METKTAEQILKEHIPNGCINVKSYKEENAKILQAMKEIAELAWDAGSKYEVSKKEWSYGGRLTENKEQFLKLLFPNTD